MTSTEQQRVEEGKVRDEYAIVGPACFVMATMPCMAKQCILAISGHPVDPEEVWIDIHSTWVRLDGSWISGWRDGRHFGFRPHWLNRWKIRRAARAWRRTHLQEQAS